MKYSRWLILLFLVACAPQPQIRVEQVNQVYLPLAMKSYRSDFHKGVAASGNGGYQAIIQTGAKFYLNWTTTSWDIPNVEFVPMISSPLEPPDVPQYDEVAPSEYLMGANEPSYCPIDYVETWRIIVLRFSDRLLVAPGVGLSGGKIYKPCTRPDGSETDIFTGAMWIEDLRTFYIQQYGDPHFAAISLHCYPPPETSCNALTDTQQFIDLAILWNVPEVWVTEWDAGKWGAQSVERERQWIEYWKSSAMITRIAYYQNTDPEDGSYLVDSVGNLTMYGENYQ